MRVGTTKLCAYSWTQWTRSEQHPNKGQHDTRTSWPSTTIQSQTQGLLSQRSCLEEGDRCYKRSHPREARTQLGRTLQNHFVAQERHLSPGDTRRTKVATSMEHRAPKEILPVDEGMQTTPHFQFISFQLYLLSTVLFSPKVSFLFFQNNFAYARVYHNKRSYSEISYAYIHPYTSTTKSLGGWIHPRGCLKIYTSP